MTGHVRRRGARSWEIKFDQMPDAATGRRKSRYVSFKGTKREAEAELVRLLAAEQTGQGVDPTKQTFGEFLERWDRDWVQVNVSLKTAERYSEIVKKHVVPGLGRYPIQRLKPVNLSEHYSRLLRGEPKPAADASSDNVGKKPLSARTVGHCHRVIHRALGHAVKWGVVAINVASQVSPPRVQSQEIEILRLADLKVILAKLAGHPLEALAVTALATGMRRGELLAMRWQDLDLEKGIVRVERSLEQTKAGLRFKSPKTRAGRRTVTLPAHAISVLRAHRKAQQEQRLALGLGKAPPEALVLPGPDLEPRSPNAVTKAWAAFAREVGVSVSFHGLRHTCASQMIAAGVDILSVSRRLGHSAASVTLNVYAHLLSDADDRAAQALDAAFSSAVQSENL